MAEKSKRGFASMDPEKQRAIAKKGGQAVKPEHRSFSQNKDLAQAAGSKGGKSVDPAKRTFANKDLAKAAGAKGGKAKSKKPVPEAAE